MRAPFRVALATLALLINQASAQCSGYYTTCTSCASAAPCTWAAYYSYYGASGTCVLTSSAYLYTNAGYYTYLYSSSCPSSYSCTATSCSSCASSGCRWIASSYTYGSSGICVSTSASYSSSTYPYSYTSSGSCPSSSSPCSASTCSSCAETSDCQWIATSYTYGSSGTCISTYAYYSSYSYPYSYTSSGTCPDASSCGSYYTCTSCTTANCYWFSDSLSYYGGGGCYSPSNPSSYYTYGYELSAQCPSIYSSGTGVPASQLAASRGTSYIPAITSGTNAVAAICSLVAGGGLLIFILIRAFHPAAKSLSSAEANVIFCSRVGVLQIFIGIAGLASAFTTLSSILTLCGGAVAVATMKNLSFASDIANHRAAACSHPLHAANLAIAGIVFAAIDFIINISLRATILPFILMFQAWCGGGTWDGTDTYYFSRTACSTYAQPFSVVAVYIINGVTLSILNIVLNIVFIAVYCQVQSQIGHAASVCFCGSAGVAPMPISPGATQIIYISPRGGHPVPYGQQMVPYGQQQQAAPYGQQQQAVPYGQQQQAAPYGQQQAAPYGQQQAAPYGQQQAAPYGQQAVPYGQQQPVQYGQQPVFYGQQQPVLYGQQQPAQYDPSAAYASQVQPVPYGQPYDPSIYATQQAQQPSYDTRADPQ